jgi:acetyltransferase-like isoleucine patch superfamily enzyme
MLIVSPLAKVSQLADIEDSVYGSRIIVEDGAVIDSFVKIKPAGGEGDVRIGHDSFVNSGTVIYTGNGVDIGANVLIAANCTFASVNHEYRSKDILIRDQGFMAGRGGIIVEDDVWIGANTVILDGAVIRQGAVVGAGSLVRGELSPYSVNRGVPTTEVGKRE